MFADVVKRNGFLPSGRVEGFYWKTDDPLVDIGIDYQTEGIFLIWQQSKGCMGAVQDAEEEDENYLWLFNGRVKSEKMLDDVIKAVLYYEVENGKYVVAL